VRTSSYVSWCAAIGILRPCPKGLDRCLREVLLEDAGIHEMGLTPVDGPPTLFGCDGLEPTVHVVRITAEN